jgi:hypothetical protein
MAAEIANEEMVETIGYEEVIASLENLDVKELAAILDRGSTLLKKMLGKGPSKKKGTGIVPPQLEQNHEWVRFVLGDAKLNGWESFEMRTTKVDKSSGQKQVELVTMAGSVEKDGVHVFEDTDKEFTQKDAMSYAKCLKERNDELYQRFMEDYAMEVPKKEVTKTVKKTSEELEREKEEKKAAKEREKEEKKAAKEREKEEKKAEKEREKAAKEVEKACEKAEKEAEKEAKGKKLEKKMVLVPVKRERSASPVPTTAATAATVVTPAKKIVVKKPVAPVKAPQEEEEEDMIDLDD